LSTPYAPGVIAAGSMTGLALQLTVPKGRIRVFRYRMLGAKDCQDHLIVMALETRVGAFLAVRRSVSSIVSRLG
jgi:hypothetical protein